MSTLGGERATFDSHTIDTGTYVAISGNTGAGKSTLVSAICNTLKHVVPNVIGADERRFHHPLLPLMFAAPKRFALPIQLNFAIQRGLWLMNALSEGNCVVMERSHLDDRLYVTDHRNRGNIDEPEYQAYLTLSHWFAKMLRHPHVHVLLDVSPDTSFRRVKGAERAGQRPEEFPDDATLKSYIESWHHNYLAFFDSILESKQRGILNDTAVLRFGERHTVEEIAATVAAVVTGRGTNAAQLRRD